MPILVSKLPLFEKTGNRRCRRRDHDGAGIVITDEREDEGIFIRIVACDLERGEALEHVCGSEGNGQRGGSARHEACRRAAVIEREIPRVGPVKLAAIPVSSMSPVLRIVTSTLGPMTRTSR